MTFTLARFVSACVVAASLAVTVAAATEFAGARVVRAHGFDNCVELANTTTRVVLEPNLGGRVASYALGGVEVLQQDRAYDGATLDSPDRPGMLPGGRFDVGPEFTLPAHPVLWAGRWRADITGERAARLTSEVDPITGLQLVREFQLAPASSHLRCTQTMINRGSGPRSACHWSRTLAEGGGICLAPLNPASRYPQGYLTYRPDGALLFRPPAEPNVSRRDGLLLLLGPPAQKKFAIDAREGWLAYLTRSGVLFVKRFPVYPDRPYGEIAGNAVSLWYSEDRACEVEPIGPLETLAPGARAAFTEDWSLHRFEFPADRTALDVAAVRRIAAASPGGISP